jgi:RNA polymerase sigma-70 factor (ECF subfamily)
MSDDADLPDVLADARRRRFEALYAEHQAVVLGYVLRRTDSAHDAADVIAETFLVAWRRLDDAPTGASARLWLFGVARRVLANHRRGERRRTELAERLRGELAGRDAPAAPSGELGELAAAFGSLGDGDREVLALEAWEGLRAGEVATVLGCSRNAARIRLHRARRRLRAAIVASQGPGSDGAPPPRAAKAVPTRVVEAPEANHPGARGYRPGRADDVISMRGSI